VTLNVPNDGRAIVAGGDSLGISLVNANVSNAASVLLQGSLHDLGLFADSPDSNLTFHTTGNNALAVRGGREGGNTVVVSVVNGVEELARLGQESTDLAIVPSGDDALAISHEGNGEALEAWDFNSEELLAGLHVPHADVVN
jgi:hypothetical protein